MPPLSDSKHEGFRVSRTAAAPTPSPMQAHYIEGWPLTSSTVKISSSSEFAICVRWSLDPSHVLVVLVGFARSIRVL